MSAPDTTVVTHHITVAFPNLAADLFFVCCAVVLTVFALAMIGFFDVRSKS